MKNILKLFLIFTSICYLFSCQKLSNQQSNNQQNDTFWLPVYSKGAKDFVGIFVSWEGEVGPMGSMTGTYEKEGKTINYSFWFYSYYFYREEGQDYYITFRGDKCPDLDGQLRLKYYIEDGILFLEDFTYPGERPDDLLSPAYREWIEQDPIPSGRYMQKKIDEMSSGRMVLEGTVYEKRNRQ